ncbi:MAG: DUF3048 domain-containing protein [Actinobacteria bacterium]|nr:DUF3048 domain-containing protein [Actinomycetota bacterium]
MLRRIFSGIIIAILLTSCSFVDGNTASKRNPIPPAPTPTFTFNSLSGRVGNDGRVLAVKIDDTKQARPQIGLTEADVVYIEQVEGGVTRLAAIYSSRYPTLIGPVRSARISDMELLDQYGKVAFAFSGAQRKLRPVIDSANLFNLGAEREGVAVYSRDSSRRAPWNMILHPQNLFSRVDKRGLEIATARNIGWTFTFVAQVVSVTDSGYGDKFGGKTPLITSVGSGNAYIFRDGRVIRGIWTRLTSSEGTHFTTEDGAEISFKAGQIWIALVDREPEINYPAAPAEAGSASPTPSK